MDAGTIRVEVLSPDDGDGLILFRVAATNGVFSAAQEFYDYSDGFKAFGRELSAFPANPLNVALFELGSTEGNAAYYLRLKAYLFDAVGHAAVEFVADNRREGQYLARAAFQIHCEVAAINRLGRAIAEWDAEAGAPLIWNTRDNRI